MSHTLLPYQIEEVNSQVTTRNQLTHNQAVVVVIVENLNIYDTGEMSLFKNMNIIAKPIKVDDSQLVGIEPIQIAENDTHVIEIVEPETQPETRVETGMEPNLRRTIDNIYVILFLAACIVGFVFFMYYKFN